MITYSRSKWMALVALSALSVVFFTQVGGAASKGTIQKDTFKVKQAGGNVHPTPYLAGIYKKACISVPPSDNLLPAKIQVQLQRKLPNRPFQLNSGYEPIGPWITVVKGTPYWYKTIPSGGDIYLTFRNKDCSCDVGVYLVRDPN